MYNRLNNEVKEKNLFFYVLVFLTFLNFIVNLSILIIIVEVIVKIENNTFIRKLSNINFDIFDYVNVEEIKYLLNKIKDYDIINFFENVENCIIDKC